MKKTITRVSIIILAVVFAGTVLRVCSGVLHPATDDNATGHESGVESRDYQSTTPGNGYMKRARPE